MTKIKVGVIGMGFIGPLHADAVNRTHLAEVVAIAGSGQAKTEAKARELGIEKAYGDYRELLADREIEAVHITTPNYLHFEMVKAALASGKHVVCDKPLAMTVWEGEELLKLAEGSGLICAVNYNCRAYPMVQQARVMSQSGELGDIFCVNGSYQQDWLLKDTDYNWRLEPDKGGLTRTVSDIGSHWFDMIEHITGQRLTRVCADFAILHKTRKKPLKPIDTYANMLLTPEDYADIPVTTEDYAAVLFHLDHGGHGTFTANQCAAGRKNRLYFEIYGSKKSLAFDSEKPNELFIGERDRCNAIMMKDPSLMDGQARTYTTYPGGHAEGFGDSARHTMLRIYQAIRDGQPDGDYPNFRDGLRDMLISDAVYASVQQGKWVEI